MKQESLLKVLPPFIRRCMERLSEATYEQLQEIRLRANQPVLLKVGETEWGLGEKGLCQVKESLTLSPQDITDTLRCMSDFSLYALADEMRQGFITLEGGHRVGLVGRGVLEDNTIKTLKYISGMNIRIAHEVIGCSKPVMPYILGRERVYHTLIISPPGCGKTTLLRDMIYQLSEGYCGYGPYTVGIVDERSEIAACYQGVPQNHVGRRTDVLDGCPKVEGMRMLLRAMAPKVIAVDEIGSQEDCLALEEILNAGVTVICSVHGKSIEECLKRPALASLLEKGLFERFIVLSHRAGPCTLERVSAGVGESNLMG